MTSTLTAHQFDLYKKYGSYETVGQSQPNWETTEAITLGSINDVWGSVGVFPTRPTEPTPDHSPDMDVWEQLANEMPYRNLRTRRTARIDEPRLQLRTGQGGVDLINQAMSEESPLQNINITPESVRQHQDFLASMRRAERLGMPPVQPAPGGGYIHIGDLNGGGGYSWDASTEGVWVFNNPPPEI